VQAWVPHVEAILAADQGFVYRENRGITKTVATLLTRASFVKEYLDSNPPKKEYGKVPIYSYPGDIGNPAVPAQIVPEFNFQNRNYSKGQKSWNIFE